MQQEISDDVKIGSSLIPFQSVRKSPAIDKTASGFGNANLKVKKIRRLIEWSIYEAEISRCIPGTLDLVFQGMIEKIMIIEQPAVAIHSNKEILDLKLILDNKYYTNVTSIHLCFSIRFKKLSNIAYTLEPDIYPVNTFFAHGVREIDITKYGTKKSLIPTNTPKEIYKYSNSMLKQLPKKKNYKRSFVQQKNSDYSR